MNNDARKYLLLMQPHWTAKPNSPTHRWADDLNFYRHICYEAAVIVDIETNRIVKNRRASTLCVAYGCPGNVIYGHPDNMTVVYQSKISEKNKRAASLIVDLKNNAVLKNNLTTRFPALKWNGIKKL